MSRWRQPPGGPKQGKAPEGLRKQSVSEPQPQPPYGSVFALAPPGLDRFGRGPVVGATGSSPPSLRDEEARVSPIVSGILFEANPLKRYSVEFAAPGSGCRATAPVAAERTYSTATGAVALQPEPGAANPTE